MPTTEALKPEITHPSQLPAVDKVLLADAMLSLRQKYGQDACTQAVREVLTTLRKRLLQAQSQAEGAVAAPVFADIPGIVQTAQQQLEQRFAPRLRAVFNLTGTVLHTNLGRALLPQEAVDAVIEAMTSAANLEYDLEDGSRGDRDDLVESLICELTGAEAATIVNNNAAAVLLVLSTLAADAERKEVVVSRGELVEIGGAFRIPDVMTRAGAQLVEVGTTNRTHDKDYRGAIGERTAALMKVHCSNYAITGFTKSVADADVVFVVRAVGGAYLDQGGASAGHHIGDAEGAANLHQLAARDDDFFVQCHGGQHQQHGGGVVVDDGGSLGTCQAADQVFDQVIAVAPAAIGQVVFQVAGCGQGLYHRVNRLLRQQGAAQVGVQHGTRQVVDGPQARRKQLLQLVLGGAEQAAHIGRHSVVFVGQPVGARIGQRGADGVGALRFAVARQQVGGAWVLQQLVDGGQVERCSHGALGAEKTKRWAAGQRHR